MGLGEIARAVQLDDLMQVKLLIFTARDQRQGLSTRLPGVPPESEA